MKMLLCSTGSNNVKATLRLGVEVAKALSAHVTLYGIADKKRKTEDLRQKLGRAAEALTTRGLQVRVLAEAGQAEDLVMAELDREQYDMVALGALSGKRSRKALLNSVGMRIIERATTSVLVIKGEPREISRVLICASGTEQGRLSVWAGAALACGANARATVLHVVDAVPAMYTGLEQMEETLAELLQSDTEMSRELKWAAQVVKAECEISELKLRRGIAADEILREGQVGDYDLIVMGSARSASGLVRALMGDLTREVVNRAQRPVLVVRPAD
jgi:nucleotide-binding universal stress UspA family protein